MRVARAGQVWAIAAGFAVAALLGPILATTAIAQGAAPSPPAATTESTKATKATKPGKPSAAKKKAAKRKKKRGKSKRKRTPQRAQKSANMPKGFTWPPSAQMKAIGASCLEALAATGLDVTPASKQQLDAAARVVTPVVVSGMKFGAINWVPTYRRPPFVMDCHLALALHRVGPSLAALGVHTVHFSRIYEFSRVRAQGRKSRAISRHALGLAVDIRKVEGIEVLPDNGGDVNHLATVHTDYHANAWLRAVEAAFNQSGLFRTVLGPQNDPKSHYDHFHVEAAASFAP